VSSLRPSDPRRRHRAKTSVRLLPVDRSAILLELAGLEDVLALHASLQREPVAGLKEILPAARTIMLRFDPARLSVATLAEALARRDLSRAPPRNGPCVEIPLRYDGEDLAEVAELAGLTVSEVLRRHEQSEFLVAFCGFAPGFAYLTGGDPALQVPRRQTPRTRVPAGSVGLAGPYCGIYPQASPGGWQIIGTTPLAMWDASRDPPARLVPGSRVRFRNMATSVVVDAWPVQATLQAESSIGQDPEVAGHIKVIATALPALVQDLGRAGHAALGVTVGGALDRRALQLANEIVGNPSGVAALEITFGNFVCECSNEMSIALAGAPAPITVQRSSGEIFAAAAEHSITLHAGDRVKLGYPLRGVRSYLAVRGGFEVPRVLGSASRDTLAALGPEPLVKGSIVATGRAAAATATATATRRDDIPAESLPTGGETVVLDILPGPRADWFTEASLTLLLEQAWQVTPQSSRVGIRLRGEKSLDRRVFTELPSEGLTRGAIQVPHDGQPVLLLADHPVTGGYPVVAVVAEHHLDLAGQLPPGAKLRFRRLPATSALSDVFAGAP
jgi:KipI family sensor histidine kinase inhibitor